MALEDILKGFEKKAHIFGIEQALQSEANATNPEIYDSFAKYLNKYRNYAPEDAQAMAESEDMTVKKIRRDARAFREEAEENLSELVKNNYNEVISSLSNEQLEEFAMVGLKTPDKKYLSLHKAINSKDKEFLKSLLKSKYKDDPYWANFIDVAHESTLTHFAINYMQREQEKFMIKNLCDEKTVKKDGKDVKTYVKNQDKIKAYIKKTIDSYTQPEDKIDAYNKLAEYVFQAKFKK